MEKNPKILIIYVSIIVTIMLSLFLYEKYIKPVSGSLSVVDNHFVQSNITLKCYCNIYYSQLTSTTMLNNTSAKIVSPIVSNTANPAGTLNPYNPSNGIPAINIVGIYNINSLSTTSAVTNMRVDSVVYFYSNLCASGCVTDPNTTASIPNISTSLSTNAIQVLPSDTKYTGGLLYIPVSSVLKTTNMYSTTTFQRMIIKMNNIDTCSIIIYFYDVSSNFRQITIANIPAVCYLELNFFY